MDLNELRKLAPADAIKKAAEFVGVSPTVLDGMWRTESGRGANKLSRAGARGDFQIMPGTQALFEKKLGLKFDPDNFHDSLFMAAHHLKDDLAREGNITDALKAYNAGPKRDRWNNPETASYPSKVLGTDEQAAAVKPGPQAIEALSLNSPAEKKLEKGDGILPMPKSAVAMGAATFLNSLLGTTTPPGYQFQQEVRAGAEASATAEKERKDQGLVDSARDVFMHQGVTGAVLTRASRDIYPRDPNYSVNEQDLVGYGWEDQQQLRESGSQTEFNRNKFEIETRNEDMRRATVNGGAHAFAASLLAGLPEGYVTGVATAKALAVAGYGSMAAAQAGNTGRAVALSAVENVGGNLLSTAAEDAITGRMSVFDYGVTGTLGAMFTGLSIPGINKAAMKALHIKTQREAVTKQLGIIEQARKNLGQDATAQELMAEMQRLEAASIAGDLSVVGGKLPASRQLLDDGTLRDLGHTDESLMPVADESKPITVLRPDSGKMQTQPRDMYMDESQAAAYEAAYARPDVISENVGRTSAEQARIKQELTDLYTRDSGGLVTTDGMPPAVRAAAEWFHSKFLADTRLVLAYGNYRNRGTTLASLNDTTLGAATFLGPRTHLIVLNQDAKMLDKVNIDEAIGTLTHEFGHAIWQQHAARIPKAKLQRLVKEYEDWNNDYLSGESGLHNRQQIWRRSSLTQSEYVDARVVGASGDVGSLFEVIARKVLWGEVQDGNNDKMWASYWGNLEEFTAEQFVKYIETAVKDTRFAGMPNSITTFFADLFAKLANLWKKMTDSGYNQANESFRDFFESVYKMHKAERTKAKRAAQGLNPERDASALPVEPPLIGESMAIAQQQDIATRFGLDLMPEATPRQIAEKKAMISLYTRAANPEAPWNNIDPKVLDRLTDNDVANVASTGLLLLKSDNPVVRMTAAELLESTTGGAGRRDTAALAKYIHERKFMGNSINELQGLFSQWANSNGITFYNKWMTADPWARFNMQVAEHIEFIRNGGNGSDNPIIVGAANVVQGAYERMRVAQIANKTLGHGALPETSVGYMPHRMSSEKLRNLTPAQERVVWDALVEQFIGTEGWDISFSANLASKYLDVIRSRANGGYAAPLGAHGPGGSDVIMEALANMGVPAEEISMHVAKFNKGGAAHTKKRLNLDLLAEHVAEDGTRFRLLDLYETDQLTLMRSQARRVSGEVALARHGVMGRSGLNLLRKAMDFGEANGKVQAKEVEAFDQMAAEFLGDPFGSHGSVWVDRAMQFTSLSRLGGMGITQFAEYINAAAQLGIGHMFSAIGGMRRLRDEVKTLAAGGKVDNPIIGSIERAGGAEFGTDPYKFVFPFDNPDVQYQVNGTQTLALADRLLRGGTHAQAKLSLWRTIHSVQQRGVAEQVVHKALNYIKAGKDDVVLQDMGISPELAMKIKAQMSSDPLVARWEGGRLVHFDVTKLDRDTAREFISAVHRGTSQIIQGTFIGETGKWAHDGWMKLLTQFRTFSITSVEKQWGRNLNNHGLAKALGMMVGSMSIAVPLHMARVYAASLGRPDQDKYLDEQLTAEKLARASLNYIAMSGLSGDFLDAFGAVTGVASPTGGRPGGGSDFVGSVVAPAASTANDVWKGIQNTKDGTNPHELIKNLPFAKLPYFIPIVNMLK